MPRLVSKRAEKSRQELETIRISDLELNHVKNPSLPGKHWTCWRGHYGVELIVDDFKIPRWTARMIQTHGGVVSPIESTECAGWETPEEAIKGCLERALAMVDALATLAGLRIVE